MNDLAITRYRAVATSAVRESNNRREFLRRVRDQVGMRLEVISGSEEIRLVHAAVRRRMALGTDPWVLVELGGGSVEIGTGGRGAGALERDPRHGRGAAAGAVRARGRRAVGVRTAGAGVRGDHADPGKAAHGKGEGLHRHGGNIDALARSARGGGRVEGPQRISLAELRAAISQLSRVSVEERMRRFGLRPDRADVIVPAAIVYERLAEMVGAEEILVPGGGVREGIVFDLMERLTHRQDSREEQAVEDAVQLGRKFLFDETHARARRAPCRFPLRPACRPAWPGRPRTAIPCHGRHPSRRRRIRELQGASQAFAVPHLPLRAPGIHPQGDGHHRHHCPLPSQGPPSSLHPEFALLSPAERDRVRKLSALLRIADALDKEHRQKITGIEVGAADGQVQNPCHGRRGGSAGAVGPEKEGRGLPRGLRHVGDPHDGRREQMAEPPVDLGDRAAVHRSGAQPPGFFSPGPRRGAGRVEPAAGARQVPLHRELQPRGVLHGARGGSEAADRGRGGRGLSRRPLSRGAAGSGARTAPRS